MRKKFYVLVLLCIMPHFVVPDGLDTLKGIWSSVQKFPPFTATFWKGLGRSFGAPPTGYRYSFDVYNDMRQPVWVGVTEIMSCMGGDFPKPDGWSVTEIPACLQAPLNHYQVLDKQYYFEMLIKSSDRNYSTNMPYVAHGDVLYRQDAIALNEKNSTHLNYFRAFMGKTLQNGAFVHVPKAEYLGYSNQSTTAAKQDVGNVSLTTTLSSLVLYNSSNTDYFVGFVSQANATAMTKQSCQVFALVQAHSFALLKNFATVTSLSPGTIGLFDATSQALLMTYNLPTSVFKDMPYTLEIYQDAGATVQMDLQGLMSGNYDQPISSVRDITPVSCVFWYQSVAQLNAKGYMDLPGNVWIVSVADKNEIVAGAKSGDAVQFEIMRPEIGKKLWIYFIYVATQDQEKVQQFLEGFLSGSIAKAMLQTYHEQAVAQMKLVKQQVDNQAVASGKNTAVAQSVLVAAAQGALQMNGGQMVDPVSGVTGYLLGADLFLPYGVGMQPLYYLLSPSRQNSAKMNVPQQTVQNLFSGTLSTKAPKNMPTPIIATVAAQA